MDRVVQDVEVLENSVGEVLGDNKMVRLVRTTVGALTIPICFTIAVDNVAIGAGDDDVGTRDDDRVEVAVLGVSKGGFTSKHDRGTSLEGREVDGAGGWSRDGRQDDVGARVYSRGYIGIRSDGASSATGCKGDRSSASDTGSFADRSSGGSSAGRRSKSRSVGRNSGKAGTSGNLGVGRGRNIR